MRNAPAKSRLALWFHDAIYDLPGHDNEAAECRLGARCPARRRHRRRVRPTRARPHHGDEATTRSPTIRMHGLLVDIDLSILGAAAARFAEYERQIRAEYAHVPPDVFEPRRRLILARFLARDPLYQTPGMRACCEAQARINLRGAIGD